MSIRRRHLIYVFLDRAGVVRTHQRRPRPYRMRRGRMARRKSWYRGRCRCTPVKPPRRS